MSVTHIDEQGPWGTGEQEKALAVFASRRRQEACSILDALDGDERTGGLTPLQRGILNTSRTLRACEFHLWPSQQQMEDLRAVLLAACPDALSYEGGREVEEL